MPAKINGAEIPADVRERLGIKLQRPRKPSMRMEEVRSYTIRVLHVMADLTQVQRARVLTHAEKVNNV